MKEVNIKIMHTLITLKSLNSFNPELQPRNTEFAFKNQRTLFLNELRGFKFTID